MFFLVGDPELDYKSTALAFVGRGLVFDIDLGSAIAKELDASGYLGLGYLMLPFVNSFHIILD